MDDEELRQRAFHEAGHAVVGVLLGIEVTSVVVTTNVAECNTHFDSYDPQASSDDEGPLGLVLMRNQVALRLAGAASEQRAFDGHVRWAGHDIADVHRETKWMAGEAQAGAVHVEERRRANLLVDLAWAQIEAVADRLLHEHELDGDDLYDLVVPPAIPAAEEPEGQQAPPEPESSV
ncbi:MAG TPA: hypothetical protein VF423_13505 [Actinomycetes bacterium]